MNKKLMVSGVLIVLLIVLFFVFTNKGNQDAVLPIINSDDGRVSLEIPKGSLPEGVSIEDVSVQKVTQDKRTIKDEGYVEYEMLPDGLKLNKPIMITIKEKAFEEGIFSIPYLAHISKDSEEYIGNFSISYDADTGDLIIQTEIEHFSRFVMNAENTFGFFTVELIPRSRTFYQGQTIDIGFRFAPTGLVKTYTTDGSIGRAFTRTQKLFYNQQYYVSESLMIDPNEKIEPSRIRFPSKSAAITDSVDIGVHPCFWTLRSRHF